MRPFRVEPPNVEDALLRRGVQRLLLDRFERRVTVVRAGAGFGKTTSLAQAVAQNRISPRGIDLWVTCEPGDSDADHLLIGICVACGLSPDGALDDVVASVAARSPAAVSIVFDDAHEVAPDTAGAELLTELIASMPGNGHIVFASRTRPPVALTRLAAQGQVTEIGEDTLALDASEVEQIAPGLNGSPGDDTALGGWPALVSLAARTENVVGFLDEEVFSWLDDAQIRALETVVALGGANDSLIESIGAASGGDLSDLPLVHESDGWYEAHDLWSGPLLGRMNPDRVGEMRALAIGLLLDDGDLHRAVELCLLSDNVELLDVAVRRIIVDPMAFDRAEVKSWATRLPDSVRTTAAGAYLAGLVAQSADPTDLVARELMERAAEGFRELGDADAEVAALVQLGYWHHIQRDATGLITVGIRLAELAQLGVRLAEPYVAIGEAFVGLAQGDPDKVLAAARRVDSTEITPGFQAITAWAHSQGLEMAGYPSVELADQAVSSGVPIPGVSVIAFSARWRNGRIEELLSDQSWWEEVDTSRDYFLRNIWLAVVAGAVGDVTLGGHHLDNARRTAGAGAPQIDIALGLVEAAIASVTGDVVLVKSTLTDLFDLHPPAESNRFTYGGATSLILRYFPEYDEYFRLPGLGPLRRRDIDLGIALREFDAGSLAGVAGAAWPERHGELLPALYCRGACEFIAAAWAVGRPEAQAAASWMADVIGASAREVFRDLAGHDNADVAKAAAEIVSMIPVTPAHVLAINVLGAATIRWNGEEVVDPNWRRERVRSLLGFLISHPVTTRDSVMAALWPDADETAGRRSLRSTLNLLNQVLEPSRAAGDAPFFVRTDGATLRFHADEHVVVDSWRFEALLDAAERLEADGVPELALEPLKEALDLYQGEFLADAAYDDWSAAERDRLRARFVRSAVRTAELLIAFGDIEAALAVATQAVGVEPWSEPAHRAIVAAHIELGDRSSAQRALDRCHRELSDLGGPVEELTLMLERRLAI